MASFPHNFYSDHQLLYPNNFSEVQSLLMAVGDSSGMCGGGIRNVNNTIHDHLAAARREDTFIPSFDQTVVSPEQHSSDAGLSPLLTMPYPDPYGPVSSDMTVPSLPEFNMGLYDIHNLIGSQAPVSGACDYGEELFGFVPDVKPLYRDIWGSESESKYDQIMHGVEETNIKVASRYSEEERKERIVRYLKKRNQRNFNKTIKYACRKTLADRRTRVRGRFARNNNELICDTEIPLKTNQLTTPTHNINLIKQQRSDHQTNKEDQEESWLQELTASLMYLPYVTNYSGLGV